MREALKNLNFRTYGFSLEPYEICEVPVASYNRPALPFWRKTVRAPIGRDAEEFAGHGERWNGPVLCFEAGGDSPSAGMSGAALGPSEARLPTLGEFDCWLAPKALTCYYIRNNTI